MAESEIINNGTSGMSIIEDTRQQVGKHCLKRAYFKLHGITVVRSKLFVGDYMSLDNPKVAIDTKKDLVEVATNLTQQHERFRAECEKARALDIHLIVLVEEPNVKTLADVNRWHSPIKKSTRQPYTKLAGTVLFKIMYTMQQKYGVEWQFCTKETAGKRIAELLYADTDKSGGA